MVRKRVPAAPKKVNTKASSVKVSVIPIGCWKVSWTDSEEMVKATMVKQRFLSLPVSPLSKSTRPPAMMPRNNGEKYVLQW